LVPYISFSFFSSWLIAIVVFESFFDDAGLSRIQLLDKTVVFNPRDHFGELFSESRDLEKVWKEVYIVMQLFCWLQSISYWIDIDLMLVDIIHVGLQSTLRFD